MRYSLEMDGAIETGPRCFSILFWIFSPELEISVILRRLSVLLSSYPTVITLLDSSRGRLTTPPTRFVNIPFVKKSRLPLASFEVEDEAILSSPPSGVPV